jgi:hypothetical protein
MDDALETSTERVRHHLRRPLAGSRNLLMKTAGNTVVVTDPRGVCGPHAASSTHPPVVTVAPGPRAAPATAWSKPGARAGSGAPSRAVILSKTALGSYAWALPHRSGSAFEIGQ